MGTWIAFAQIALALAVGWMALIPLMALMRARHSLQRPSIPAEPVTYGRRPGPRGDLTERVSGD
jgi:hypothetical protein